ncbi:MAG: tetratricopeptide repeat protein, partial [Anaerolineae bacterium]
MCWMPTCPTMWWRRWWGKRSVASIQPPSGSCRRWRFMDGLCPPVAVDYLLQPYQTGFDSSGTLGRLVGMHFARREAGQYFWHPVDQAYALDRIPKGEKTDRFERGTAQYTRYALYDRAANYFAKSRKPREEWKTIGDLAPQLAEIDLRIAGEDYDTAADVLTDIGYDYLLLWGQYKLMIALHGRLQGKITDKYLEANSLNNMALASNDIGQVRKAIEFYEAALPLVQELGEKQAEGALLGNLGLAYSDLGEIRKAITYHEQALQIDREIGDKRGEGALLGNLGLAYSDLGEIRKAITYYEQALQIDREIGDKRGEGIDLGNLGNRYAELGEPEKAISYYEQAFEIYRVIGDRDGERVNLGNLAERLIELGEYAKAIEHTLVAIRIGEEIGNPKGGSYGNQRLASAHFYAGNLKAAQEAISAARAYDVPENNHNVHALVGVIAARLGE